MIMSSIRDVRDSHSIPWPANVDYVVSIKRERERER
jgi:hypothetical protein